MKLLGHERHERGVVQRCRQQKLEAPGPHGREVWHGGAMRLVYLLRHAKSSWKDGSLPDRERPLAGRGRRAAKAVARHLETSGIRPDLVLCSPARRTRETLERVRAALGDEIEVRFDERLYGASAPELLARLRALPAEVAAVMVVGHNPGLEQLALTLASSGARLAELTEKLPTAALATIELPADRWDAIEPGSGELVGYVRPRDLT
jgi:phosphohistidine phosphatase